MLCLPRFFGCSSSPCAAFSQCTSPCTSCHPRSFRASEPSISTYHFSSKGLKEASVPTSSEPFTVMRAPGVCPRSFKKPQSTPSVRSVSHRASGMCRSRWHWTTSSVMTSASGMSSSGVASDVRKPRTHKIPEWDAMGPLSPAWCWTFRTCLTYRTCRTCRTCRTWQTNSLGWLSINLRFGNQQLGTTTKIPSYHHQNATKSQQIITRLPSDLHQIPTRVPLECLMLLLEYLNTRMPIGCHQDTTILA